MCLSALATMEILTCKHRIFCKACLEKFCQPEEPVPLQCPTCRAEFIKTDVFESLVQLDRLTIQDRQPNFTESRYPFGVLLCCAGSCECETEGVKCPYISVGKTCPRQSKGKVEYAEKLIWDQKEINTCMRELLDAKNTDDLSYDSFVTAMERFPKAQREMALVHFIKTLDLHQLTTVLSSNLLRFDAHTSMLQSYTRNMFKGTSNEAIMSRAVAGVIPEIIGITNAAGKPPGLCLALNAVVLTVFAGVEVYRWSNNEITASEMFINIGEHGVGTVAGSVGGIAGARAGFYIAGPIGMVVGTLLGGVAADYFARKTYRDMVDERGVFLEEQKEVILKELTEEAAERLGASTFVFATVLPSSPLLSHHVLHPVHRQLCLCMLHSLSPSINTIELQIHTVPKF